MQNNATTAQYVGAYHVFRSDDFVSAPMQTLAKHTDGTGVSSIT